MSAGPNGGAGPAPGAVSLRGLVKTYGSTRALQGLDLDLQPGEVVGIAGPNGAGKSTLLRILAGEEMPDNGEIASGGQRWTTSYLERHVAVVHQEPQLFPNLTLADNLLVGREGTRFLKPRPNLRDREITATMGVAAYADRPIAECPLATQQRAEIGRALACDARVFLFDEPNSALTENESSALFRELHRLARAGKIVLLVTHRFKDLADHARRVVVIRDGRVAAHLEGTTLTEEAIAHCMVEGLAPNDAAQAVTGRPPPVPGCAPALEVRAWSQGGGAFLNVDLTAARGEIVALLGVEGSGAREFIRSLAGLEKADGTILVNGIAGIGPARLQTAYVAPSRGESLFHNLSIGDNLLARLGTPEIAGRFGRLKRTVMRRMGKREIARFTVKTSSERRNITTLSGGNQQKVAIAQAILTKPKLILLEEPTRGVDIGSKNEIYRLLRHFSTEGSTVVMFCTEVLEVFEVANRVHVFSEGRLLPPISVRDHGRIEELAAALARASGEVNASES